MRFIGGELLGECLRFDQRVNESKGLAINVAKVYGQRLDEKCLEMGLGKASNEVPGDGLMGLGLGLLFGLGSSSCEVLGRGSGEFD